MPDLQPKAKATKKNFFCSKLFSARTMKDEKIPKQVSWSSDTALSDELINRRQNVGILRQFQQYNIED